MLHSQLHRNLCPLAGATPVTYFEGHMLFYCQIADEMGRPRGEGAEFNGFLCDLGWRRH